MLRLILIIFLVIIFILSIVSLFTNNWLINMPKQYGLWNKCNPCVNWEKTTATLNTLRASSIILSIAALISLISIYLVPSRFNPKNIIRVSIGIVILCCIINISVGTLIRKNLQKEQDIKLNFSYSYYLQILMLVLALITLGLTFYRKNVKESRESEINLDE